MIVHKAGYNGHVQLLTLLLRGTDGSMYVQVAANGVYVVSFVLCVWVCVGVCGSESMQTYAYDCPAYLPHVQFLAIDEALVLLADRPSFDVTATNHKTQE